MSKPEHTHSLSDLHQHLRRVLALNYPAPLWITAEIAQLKRSRGHLYFELVQKAPDAEGGEIVAQADAVLWQRNYQRLRLEKGLALEEVLQEGREVRLSAQVDFHERYGLKLLIQDLDTAYTFGQLELRRRQTLQTLRDLDLLARNRALPLPLALQRVAVVSSEGAAGFQDFSRHLDANAFGYRFHCRLFAASVQGDSAEAELIAALRAVAGCAADFDCVAVLRGGGARLDLEVFDRLDLCKTAATLPLPLFTGIGHDVDETVLDLVAHSALKTPTAVADFLIQHNLFFENALLRLAAPVQQNARHHLTRHTLELAQLENTAHWHLQTRLHASALHLKQLAEALPALGRRHLRHSATALDQAEALCAALHPEAALRRGFSRTLKDGKTVTDAAGLRVGDVLETRLREGVVWSEVS